MAHELKKSLIQPVLVMGVEGLALRVLLFMSLLLILSLKIPVMIMGFCLFVIGVTALRRIAERDPQFFAIYNERRKTRAPIYHADPLDITLDTELDRTRDDL